MRHNADIGLRDLVEGFLFSLRAEGKSKGTIDYYSYLLHPLLSYAGEQGWPDNAPDTHRLREFLTWTATRTFELKVANNGGRVIFKLVGKKQTPSTSVSPGRARLQIPPRNISLALQSLVSSLYV